MYNLGTGIGYSVLDMIKALEKASGKTIAYQNCPRRVGDLASVYADPAVAAKELGWKAERGLDDMCKCDTVLESRRTPSLLCRSRFMAMAIEQSKWISVAFILQVDFGSTFIHLYFIIH